MSDLTCSCTVAPTKSLSRKLEELRSGIASNTSRISDLEESYLALNASVSTLSGQVNESAFVMVDTETELADALEAGKSIHLRGEGSEGIIDCISPHIITEDRTVIEGPGMLRFALDPANAAHPRALTIHADDVELRNFELTSTTPVASTTCYGIAFAEGAQENLGHRLKLKNLHVHKWTRCLSKDGGLLSPAFEDVAIEDCYFHTFNSLGVHLGFGFTRLNMKRCRVLGRIDAEAHAVAHNAVVCSTNVTDCRFEDCLFGETDRMGFESTISGYAGRNIRTQLRNCRATGCGSFGMSIAFGEDYLFDECKVEDVVGIGIECAGSLVPEVRYGWGVVKDCEVDGVANLSVGQPIALGISCSNQLDAQVHDNKVSNILSAVVNSSYGLQIYQSERVGVRGNRFTDVDTFGIFVQGGGTPVTDGRHAIERNTFRHSAATGDRRAVYVQGTTALVRDNVAWQRSGAVLAFEVQAGATVYVDSTTPEAAGFVTGSNLILPVP